jgi:hypothetical protein
MDRVLFRRDPFEGTGAQRRDLRLTIEGLIALAMSVTACGLTAALWFRAVAPVLSRVLSG